MRLTTAGPAAGPGGRDARELYYLRGALGIGIAVESEHPAFAGRGFGEVDQAVAFLQQARTESPRPVEAHAARHHQQVSAQGVAPAGPFDSVPHSPRGSGGREEPDLQAAHLGAALTLSRVVKAAHGEHARCAEIRIVRRIRGGLAQAVPADSELLRRHEERRQIAGVAAVAAVVVCAWTVEVRASSPISSNAGERYRTQGWSPRAGAGLIGKSGGARAPGLC